MVKPWGLRQDDQRGYGEDEEQHNLSGCPHQRETCATDTTERHLFFVRLFGLAPAVTLRKAIRERSLLLRRVGGTRLCRPVVPLVWAASRRPSLLTHDRRIQPCQGLKLASRSRIFSDHLGYPTDFYAITPATA